MTLRDDQETVIAPAPVFDPQPNATLDDAVETTYVGERPRTNHTLQPIDHDVRTARYQSPLRYPGAKSSLVPVIGEAIQRAVASRSIRRVKLLIEPFAGGASTSLRLLSLGTVDRAILSDADPLVASFWQVAASDTSKLIARMRDEYDTYVKKGGDRALARWDYWRKWQPTPGTTSSTIRFENAMKCLFLNRTTFSGILHGKAGPIGGRAQTSEHWIGCRFHPDPLAERLSYVGHLYTTGRIADVWCLDWATALDLVPTEFADVSVDEMLAYLDPPYIEKGPQLYNRAFGRSSTADECWHGTMDHEELAGALRTQIPYRWILSYDAHPDLLTDPMLYSSGRVRPAPKRGDVPARAIVKRGVDFTYTASSQTGRKTTREILLTTLPASAVPVSDRLQEV
ncbi:DNA adenine methylase [Pseudolysinimonas sp.]